MRQSPPTLDNLLAGNYLYSLIKITSSRTSTKSNKFQRAWKLVAINHLHFVVFHSEITQQRMNLGEIKFLQFIQLEKCGKSPKGLSVSDLNAHKNQHCILSYALIPLCFLAEVIFILQILQQMVLGRMFRYVLRLRPFHIYESMHSKSIKILSANIIQNDPAVRQTSSPQSSK